VLSVLVVMLESVARINAHFGPYLRAVEWLFTSLFIVECLMRLAVAGGAIAQDCISRHAPR
jgi:voltage-gated potassium channel